MTAGKDIEINEVATRLGMVVNAHGKALCPNHEDHHESLDLVCKDGKNFAFCHVCNWSADPAGLVMKLNGVEFPEAKKWLEREFGGNGKIPARKPQVKTAEKDHSSIYDYLLSAGKNSSDYLISERKIKAALVDGWEIKEYSPESRKEIAANLLEKFSIDDLLSSGVFMKGKKGNPFFTFYNHSLIFPFWQNGKVVHLQGRIDPTSKSTSGKYIHLAGNKVKAPYGLPALAGLKLGDTVHIVEGLIDALTLNSIGIPAVGIPGATSNLKQWEKYFTDFEIIHIAQNDEKKNGQKAAEILEKNITRVFWKRKLRIFHIPAQYKDLNEWHVATPGGLTSEILARELIEIIPEKVIPTIRQIQDIKYQKGKKAPEILDEVRTFVMGDLKTLGRPFVNRPEMGCYFFHDEQDRLIDIESLDFKTLLFERYEMNQHDQNEIERAIQAFIWIEGQEITPQQFSYYDLDRSTLYLATGSFYKINSTSIEKIHNGSDGVFFKILPENQNTEIEFSANGIDYFAGGFDYEKFKQSLLFKDLISYGHFTSDADRSLTPDQLRHILVVYFYGLFFESIFSDKPILTLVGIKQSGKTTLATGIGKILFGKNFSPSFLPDNRKDFRVALINNRFLILDNIDSDVSASVINDLCVAATGGQVKERKLFLNGVEVSYILHVFTVLTSRSPQFKRDDLVSRLLIFNTSKIKKCLDAGKIYGDIEKHRAEIWAEILLNLQSIIKLLEFKKDWSPAGDTRNSSFELFAKKIHSDQDQEKIIALFKKMNSEKNKFGLEDDLRFILLDELLHQEKTMTCEPPVIVAEPAVAIYPLLHDRAKLNKCEKLFEISCSGAASLSKWLFNNEDEIEEFLTISTMTDPHSQKKLFSIGLKHNELF